MALFSQLQEPMTALPGQFFAMLHGEYDVPLLMGLIAERVPCSLCFHAKN